MRYVAKCLRELAFVAFRCGKYEDVPKHLEANELSLSPQSRAKMGIIAAGKDKRENDPVLQIFGTDEGSG